MLSDDREKLKEALAKLEAEKKRRHQAKDLPYVEIKVGGEILRVITGVPRAD